MKTAECRPVATDGSPAGGPSDLPSVTVIMPIRNELMHIAASVGSLLASDYPADRITFMAVDGMSDDGTREILARIATAEPGLCLLDNPDRLQAHALNMALALACGEVIVRVDAHTIYPPDYVRRCVETLRESGADNVGGVCRTVPGADTPMGGAIAWAMGHPFGVGNALFRIGSGERRWTDTVPFGCWWRDRLLALGGFATDLPYAEDDELNGRLLQGGGRILLDPAIHADYVARPTLWRLVQMLYRYGLNKPLAARRLGRVTTWRQVVPPVFVTAAAGAAVLAPLLPWAGPAALAAVFLHLAVSVVVSVLAAPSTGAAVALRLPAVFLAMHAAYGFGYLKGAGGLLASRAPGGWPSCLAHSRKKGK
jgi:GT2 family glycosyltransferase